MRYVAALLFVIAAACSPCEQTAPACLMCGPVDDCLEPTEVCVSETCESDDDCDEGASCGNGACVPNLCG